MTRFSDFNIHGEADTLGILEECFIEHIRIKGGYHSSFRDIDNSQFVSFAKKAAHIPLEQIQWNWICEVSERREYAVACLFIAVLLHRNLYHGDWADQLYRINGYFNHLVVHPSMAAFSPLFCGDRISDLAIMKEPIKEETIRRERYFRLLVLQLSNCYAKAELIRFIESDNPGRHLVTQKYLDCVCEVFAEHVAELRCAKDFTGELFFRLSSAHIERHGGMASRCISIELGFYDYIASKYPELDGYEDDPYMSPAVFRNKGVSKYLARGYKIQKLTDDGWLDPVPTFLIVPGDHKQNAVIDLSSTKHLSPDLRLLLAKFLSKYDRRRTMENMIAVEEAFSLTCDETIQPTDLTGDDFWKQANYIKSHYGDRPDVCLAIVSLLRAAWRYIVSSCPDHDFFTDSATMSNALLEHKKLCNIIMDDIPVFAYSPGIEVGCPSRFVLLLRGYDRVSTKIGDDFAVCIDVRALGDFYRGEYISFMLESPQRAVSAVHGGPYSQLLGILCCLEKSKSGQNGERSDLTYISNSEVVELKESWNNEEMSAHSLQGYLSSFRSFIQWEAAVRGAIRFDRGVLSILKTHGSPSKGGKAVSDSDLEAVASILKERAAGSLEYSLAFAIFHILLQTNFRISQICGLRTDCIRQGISPGAYHIRSTSKTSGGEYVEDTISESVYRHLKNVIELTEQVRELCPVGGPREKIFIYKSRQLIIRQMRSDDFNRLLRQACKDAGLRTPFTAKNLRSTYMTKSYALGLEKGYSELKIRELTGHKSLKTTSGHYVDRMIDDMLEWMSGVVIGDIEGIDPAKAVVDTLPQHLCEDGSVVENGCGHCSLPDCANAIPTSCLMCPHFVTTPDYMRAFEIELNRLNGLIPAAKHQHDKDDINVKKQICILYIRQMMMVSGEEVISDGLG